MPEKIKKILMHILWLFLLGAILGFILESIFYVLKYHEFANKKGLWYGPLKPIYGTGVVLINLLLYKVKDKSIFKTFLYGVIIGTLFEYFASLFQEYVLGVYTWTYQGFNLNLNGRIYLPYCLAWGFITILYFKLIYPSYLKIFNKLYSKTWQIISLVISIFLIYDFVLTGLIAHRYSERNANIPASNKVMKYIDQHYPDELVQERMPKLRLVANIKD